MTYHVCDPCFKIRLEKPGMPRTDEIGVGQLIKSSILHKPILVVLY